MKSGCDLFEMGFCDVLVSVYTVLGLLLCRHDDYNDVHAMYDEAVSRPPLIGSFGDFSVLVVRDASFRP